MHTQYKVVIELETINLIVSQNAGNFILFMLYYTQMRVNKIQQI